MANYVRLFRSIWNNPDFVALGATDQRTYLMLMSQPDITAAGVLPRLERRWAKLAADTTMDVVESSLLRLADARFVIIDETTDEVWVRSYIRYDELFRVPNGRKSIERAIDSMLSKSLARHAARALNECLDPSLKGSGKGHADSQPVDIPSAAETTTSTSDLNPYVDPFGKGCVNGKAIPAASSQQPAPSSLASSRSRDPDGSDEPLLLPAAAEDAIQLWLTHRLLNGEKVTNVPRWRQITTNRIRDEHRAALERCTETDARKVAVIVFGITTNDAWRAATETNRSAV